MEQTSSRRTSAGAAARTRALNPRSPARRGSAGGRKAAMTYFLRLRSSQSGRLDRRFGPLPTQSTAGRSNAENPGRELGQRGRELLAPGPPPANPYPLPYGDQPRVPQLVPVRPMNWCVLGFHTNSFHSSTTCPQLFFSFWVTILAAGDESRVGRGATEKLGCGALKHPPPTHRNALGAKAAGERETPFRYAATANSEVHGHALQVVAVRRGMQRS